MPTVNERLADAEVSHAISLQGYSNGVVRRMISLLNKADEELSAKLMAAVESMPPGSFTVQRLDQLMLSVQAVNAQAYAALRRDLEAELLAYADYESGFQYSVMTSAVPQSVQAVVAVNAISADMVYAAAMARPFQGKLLSELTRNIEAARMTRIRDAVRMGFIEGETVSQIVRRIRGTKSAGYADGLLEIDRRGAEAIVRLSLIHISEPTRRS